MSTEQKPSQPSSIDNNLDSLKKAVNTINDIIDKTDTTLDKKKEKTLIYLKNYLKQLRQVPIEDEFYKLIYTFLLLKDKVLSTYGDEMLDLIFFLYDCQNFNIESYTETSPTDFCLHLFFFNNSKVQSLLDDKVVFLDKIKSRKIQFFHSTFIDKYPMEFFNKNDYNLLIDLLIIRIFSLCGLENFYTTISGLLIRDMRNILKFFKIISLYGLCLYQMPNKENFIASLLYVTGGVIRDIGRCYLKTKGIFNENLSYHKCTQANKRHDYHFIPAKILLEKECDFFETYGLKVYKNIILIIIADSQTNVYWDDYLSYFRATSDTDDDMNSDIEKELPGKVRMLHFLFLFLSDFVFFFMTNFASFELVTKENRMSLEFQSKFSEMKEFINLTADLLCLNNHNFFNVWNFCIENKKFLEMQCDKTEYFIKDKFNIYGMGFIFLLLFFKQYTKPYYLPLITKTSVYAKTFAEILLFILKTENEAENQFYPKYKEFCYGLAEILKSYEYDKEVESESMERIKRLLEESKIEEEKEKKRMNE